jgi:8-amino-7-oxononanoate synthase
MVSLEYVESLEDKRKHLESMYARLRRDLKELGFEVGNSQSHIIPILCGSESRALGLSEALLSGGVVAKAIRPPTVAEGSSRVRVSMHAGLTQIHLETIQHALQKAKLQF